MEQSRRAGTARPEAHLLAYIVSAAVIGFLHLDAASDLALVPIALAGLSLFSPFRYPLTSQLHCRLCRV